MVSKENKKLIKEIVIIKVAIVIAFFILVFPLIPTEIGNRSGIDLITQHFEQIDMFEEPVACIQQFDPVCTIGGKTFSNQCEADMAGARTLYKGECP